MPGAAPSDHRGTVSQSRHTEAQVTYMRDARSRFLVFLMPLRFSRRRRSEGFSYCRRRRSSRVRPDFCTFFLSSRRA